MKKFVCLAAGLLIISCSRPSGPEQQKRVAPSVILITVDTLRADRLSCYGYSRLQTAAIDQLASDGVLFRQAIAPAPLTLPSHASILTGTYPQYHGVRDNSGFVLPEAQETLAETLKAGGYGTGALVGAFVLDSRFGLGQGFDVYVDDFDETTVDGFQMNIVERKAEEVLSSAEEWIASASQPFFAWIHLFDPHAPYQAPEGFELPNRSAYDAEVAYVDATLGRFWEFLRERSIYDSSLIVLTSDHGEGLGEHGEATHGMFLYDTTVRVPLIFKLPKNEAAGTEVPVQVRLIDVAPTVLALAGVASPAVAQGTSLVGTWTDGKRPQLTAYSETVLPLLNYGWSDIYSIRTERYKFIQAPQPELYDLAADSAETRNLYEGNRALALQFKEQIELLSAKYSTTRAAEAQRAPDRDTAERLRSLGYAAIAAPAARMKRSGLADPKEKIEIFDQIWEAQALAASGKYHESAELLRTLLRRDDSIFLAHSVQALNLLRLKRTAEAVVHLRRAAALRPDDSGSRLYLGLALLELNRPGEAKKEFEQALKLDPESEAALNNLGAAHIRLRRFSEAAGIFERLAQRQPGDAASWVNLGVARMMAGEHGRALQALERAAAIDPKIPEVHNNLGLIYMNSGELEKAKASFDRALQLRPDYASALKNLQELRRRM